MRTPAHKPRFTGAALAAAVFATAVSPALAEDWQFSVAPYLWLPSLDADTVVERAGGGSRIELEVSPSDVLEKLDFGLLMFGEARRGRLVLFTDLMYLRLSDDQATIKSIDFNVGPGGFVPVSAGIGGSAEATVSTTAWTGAVGLNIAGSPAGRTDLFAGVRYVDVSVDVDWTLAAGVAGPGPGLTFPATGSADADGSVLDTVAGVRGRARLADGWFLPYYADVGAGDSDLTWQAYAGVGREYRWGELVLVYRHLDYDFGDPVGGVEQMSLGGAALGAIFRF